MSKIRQYGRRIFGRNVVVSVSKLTVYGFSFVPKFTVSYDKHELLVLQFGTDLNLSWRS